MDPFKSQFYQAFLLVYFLVSFFTYPDHLLPFRVINTIIGHGHVIEEVLCTFFAVLIKLEILLLSVVGYFISITLSSFTIYYKSIISLYYKLRNKFTFYLNYKLRDKMIFYFNYKLYLN